MATTPTNFLTRLTGGDPVIALDSKAFGRPKTVVKSVIMQYLASFLDERGRNRSLLRHSTPGIASMFDAGLTPETETPMQRRIQIARMFDGVEATLPCVIVTDSGLSLKPVGLGSYDEVYFDEASGKRIVRCTVIASMSITITTAAADLTTADDLTTAIGLMLGPYRRLAGGDYLSLKSDGSTWKINLPMTEVSVPPAQHSPYEGDPTKGMYMSSVDVSDIHFEASLTFDYEPGPTPEELMRDYERGQDGGITWKVAPYPDADLPTKFPPIITSDRVGLRVGERVGFTVQNRPGKASLYSTNRHVLAIEGERLIGLSPGSADIVLSVGGPLSTDSRVLAKRSFTVTL